MCMCVCVAHVCVFGKLKKKYFEFFLFCLLQFFWSPAPTSVFWETKKNLIFNFLGILSTAVFLGNPPLTLAFW